jgi:hypothetical protein
LDSVILAHEVIHSLKKTKTPGMLLKLDLSKAFDKISWDYMREMLLAFGFDKLWVTWILNLTYSDFFPFLSMVFPLDPSPLLEELDRETPFPHSSSSLWSKDLANLFI